MWNEPHIHIGKPDAEDATVLAGPLAQKFMLAGSRNVKMLQLAHQPSRRPWHALQNGPGPHPLGNYWQVSRS